MWWLARLTARYVRSTDQIATSSKQQVEQALAFARRDQVAVARTLMEEVKRIRRGLGPHPNGGVTPLPNADAVPLVHHWVHPVIPQIAQTDAKIVGEFMTLDLQLYNCKVACEELQKARAKKDDVLERRDGLGEVYKNTTVKPDKEITEYMQLSQGAIVAEQNVSTALGLADIAYRTCHGTLDRLAKLLTPLLDA